jgi:glycosyltransferase involved in cell wall biosynthesis
MKIIIVVHNLIKDKSHLMPWRTVCDVVKFMQEDGHKAHLISLGDKQGELHGHLIPKGTREIRKSPSKLTSDLKIELKRIKPDVLFFPMTWRESLKQITKITSMNVPVIFWFPGGIYSNGACIQALKTIGVRDTLPYMLEILSNRKRQVHNFKKFGVDSIITMTTATANSAISAGWPNTKTFVIPPGKENIWNQNTKSSLPTNFKKWVANKPFYLYMGPPSGIRGIFELLKAFDIAAEYDQELRLVCLFRSDGILDGQKVENAINSCKNKNKIYSVWGSIKSNDLNSFIEACHAVTMPFVLVPSEIPLAIIEAMAWGKPIITTSPGGTGEFVKEFGLTPKVGDIKALAAAMIKLHKDHELYKDKCQKAIDTYLNHPDWKSVSRQWFNVAQQAIERGN